MQRTRMTLRSCCWFLFFGGLLCGVWADGLVNEEVKRTVDLSTHLAKISAEILLVNHGNSAAQSFIIALEPELAPHLAYVGASVSILQKISKRYSGSSLKQWTYPKCLLVTREVHYIGCGRHYYLPYLCREYEDI